MGAERGPSGDRAGSERGPSGGRARSERGPPPSASAARTKNVQVIIYFRSSIKSGKHELTKNVSTFTL